MSRWTWLAIAAIAVVLVGNMVRFTGKGAGAGDALAKGLEQTESDCIAKYAVPAQSNLGARAARGMCAELFNSFTTKERRAVIECALPQIARAGSDDGVRIAAVTCADPPTR